MPFKIKKLSVKNLLLLFLLFSNSSIGMTSSGNLEKEQEQKINIEEAKLEALQVNSLGEDSYIIGSGDVLDLKLFDAPEFSGSYKVLNDGTVPFPLIGSIFISHLTLKKASDLIQQKYSNQLLRPELYLTIKEPRPIKVSIIGEIERPGIYSLTNNEKTQLEGINQINNNGLPTVVDAIQKSGGITQSANLKDVIVTRRLPGREIQYKYTSINLLDLILHGRQDQNLFLFDGDIIKLKKASGISKESMEIAQANLSPQIINITVLGQVEKPGRMKVSANTPLVQAILLAGGLKKWKSNKNNVELIRINRDGSATRKQYKVKLSEGVSLEKNPPLKDQDIIRVNSSTLNSISTGLGAVSDPIAPIVSGLTLLKLLGN